MNYTRNGSMLDPYLKVNFINYCNFASYITLLNIQSDISIKFFEYSYIHSGDFQRNKIL